MRPSHDPLAEVVYLSGTHLHTPPVCGALCRALETLDESDLLPLETGPVTLHLSEPQFHMGKTGMMTLSYKVAMRIK